MSQSSKLNKRVLGKHKSAGIFSSCILSLSFSLACGSFAFSNAPAFADDASSLSRLEDKYFQTAFPKDEKAERIERLEKLVFGEARSGSLDERLKSLIDLLPAESAEQAPASPGQATPASPEADNSAPPPAPERKMHATEPLPDEASEPINNGSSYPAVTAIEKKLLNRDYVGESVGKRIDRLEIKAFGKTYASEDLQDRVDRLRSASGVDVAKVKPSASEWADEDEDPGVVGAPPSASSGIGGDGVQPFTGIPGGADDPSARRNYRRQQALDPYGRSRQPYDPYAGTGTFGGGGGLRSQGGGSGTFGSGLGSSSAGAGLAPEGMPPAAPDYGRGANPQTAQSPAPALGISQQLALLEREVFNKTYDKDKQETILTRLNRLETNIFPNDKTSAAKSLPERVSRLLAAVPTSQTMPPTAPKRGGRDPDFPDLDFSGPGTISQRNPGGLSKILNGLGNALSGGYTGGYVAPGTLITDPSTGLLYDQYTGTLIDPLTGAVVGRRTVTSGGYNYPNYGGFGSGMSPMTPFGGGGMGSGLNFGFGGGGMRIGGWP